MRLLSISNPSGHARRKAVCCDALFLQRLSRFIRRWSLCIRSIHHHRCVGVELGHMPIQDLRDGAVPGARYATICVVPRVVQHLAHRHIGLSSPESFKFTYG